MTLEAEIIHYADNASAKTASMDTALGEDEHFTEGHPVSARTIWQLDKRRAWRVSPDWGQEAVPPGQAEGNGAL